MLGLNNTPTLVGHFVSSPREREKRDSRRDERKEQGRNRKNKNIPPMPLPATRKQALPTVSQYQMDPLVKQDTRHLRTTRPLPRHDDVHVYRVYSKYWDILIPYFTCPKFWISQFRYLLICLKYWWMTGKQCRPRSDATFYGIWSGSTLFTEACLSKYLRLLQYTVCWL